MLSATVLPGTESRKANVLVQNLDLHEPDSAQQVELVHERTKPSVTVIDDRHHGDRLTPDRSRRTFVATRNDLPDGAFVTVAGSGPQEYLVWGDHLLARSPGGSAERRRRPQSEEVTVLTPGATVGTIRAGYAPTVHPSTLAPAEGLG